MKPVPRGAEQFEAVISAVAARCLPTPGAFDPEVPFSLLGLDSLRTIELAAELEDALGRPLPEDLLDGCPDIRALASRLHRICTAQPDEADDPYQRMLADAVLPGDVRPARRPSGSVALGRARRILLTGATGFLGAAIARELLQSTGAMLVCLVRAGAGVSGRTRVRRQLASIGVDSDVFDRRVRVVEGDLSRPQLGLDRAAFDALAADVDDICHAGAAVNWADSYAGVRAANVTGTLELLRLSCRTGAVPFHFVSSLSVCYSTSAPPQVDEEFDALPYLAGVHLGYAQSKVVAEALVREAGRRGLPVRIYRPALISGDSRTGAFNRDDLLSTFVRGCVHMGTAPDLDWALDALPVDVVARAIVHLSGAPGGVFHLAHPRPRHWRECLLWMRLYGYPLRLVPYHAWLRQLELGTDRASAAPTSHPLRALRGFFLNRPGGESGLTLPELYEDARRTHADHRRTVAALAHSPGSCPPLDAALLDTYFAAFIRAGDLPAPGGAVAPPGRTPPLSSPALSLDKEFFGRVTGLDVVAAEPLSAGSEHSIVSELAGWRSHGPIGLFRFRLGLRGQPARRVVVKVKARDADILAVGEALARLCDPAMGDEYARWSGRLGMAGSHEREVAVYRQIDPRFLRHAPEVLGTTADPSSNTWAVILEQIDDAMLIDAADRPGAWSPAATALAIDGLAALQAVWYGRERELRAAPWIGYEQSARDMVEMTALWAALADHASPAFSAWAGADMAAIQRRLISHVGHWWSPLEQAPRTLIHNDFNPRNICIRGRGAAQRLCAYDWELATLGAPQRDLAELLCFVLAADTTREEVELWISRHRAALERETGAPIDPAQWREGFRAALYDVLINRLGMYALVHRVRRQAFLPRVARTWRRLYEYYPLERGR